MKKSPKTPRQLLKYLREAGVTTKLRDNWVEYHGKVPEHLLMPLVQMRNELVAEIKLEQADDK